VDPIQNSRFLLEQLNTSADQIGKIYISYASHFSLIRIIHLLEGSTHLQAVRIVGGPAPLILGIGDLAHDRIKIPFLVIRKTGSKQRKRVVVIIDGEIGGKTDFRAEPSEQPGSKGVEGADGAFIGLGIAIEHFLHPLLHLTGRLVGECNGKNLRGGNTKLFNCIRDFGGDDPRFSTAGPRQHQQGTVVFKHRLPLLFVQRIQHRIDISHEELLAPG